MHQNKEADALTNGDYHHFAPSLRVPVELEALDFRVMNSLFAEGEAYERELEDVRAKQRAVRDSNPKGQRERKAKPGQILRERDPW